MKKELGGVNDDKYTLLVLERLPKVSFNMGFSAMLADEYILIVPFAYQL